MNIEEAKEQLKKHKKEIDQKYISARYSKAIETILNELEKKEKVIDLMAEHMAFDMKINSIVDVDTYKKQIKEIFYKKVEG